MAQLIDRCAEVADWDLSTRKANEVYIRRVIKPALGHLQVRKIRGPLLDLLYAQLRRCSDPGCTGKKFVEQRNVPLLDIEPGGRRPARQQVVEAIGAAIRSGLLAAGEPLPSVREMSALQDVPVATLQRARHCTRAGCQPHVRKPMTAKTIRNVSLLSHQLSRDGRFPPPRPRTSPR